MQKLHFQMRLLTCRLKKKSIVSWKKNKQHTCITTFWLKKKLPGAMSNSSAYMYSSYKYVPIVKMGVCRIIKGNKRICPKYSGTFTLNHTCPKIGKKEKEIYFTIR